MMEDKEFNLSEFIVEEIIEEGTIDETRLVYIKDHNIKEFIKRLKEEFNKDIVQDTNEVIDKLAGKDLI